MVPVQNEDIVCLVDGRPLNNTELPCNFNIQNANQTLFFSGVYRDDERDGDRSLQNSDCKSETTKRKQTPLNSKFEMERDS